MSFSKYVLSRYNICIRKLIDVNEKSSYWTEKSTYLLLSSQSEINLYSQKRDVIIARQHDLFISFSVIKQS